MSENAGIVIGFISLAILIIVQITLFAFGYGKLSQKVTDYCNRIDKLEQKVGLIESSFIEKIIKVLKP